MLSSSRWQEGMKLKFIPQWGLIPVKSIPLSYFISLSFIFSFLFWPFCTHQHISACLWDVTDTMMEKRSTKNNCAYFFILMMNLESFPDGTFITLNVFCRGGNWPEKHWATTCIYRTLTFLLPISVKHLWVISPAFLAYDWLFEIRHLNFRYVHLYLYSQWAILTRHFEIKMPVALFSGDWQKFRFLFTCLGFFILCLNHIALCKGLTFCKNNGNSVFLTCQLCRRECVHHTVRR